MLEALPQTLLQLFIVSKRNRLDLLLIFATFSSMFSVCRGVVNGFYFTSTLAVDLYKGTSFFFFFKDKKCLFTAIFLPFFCFYFLLASPSMLFLGGVRVAHPEQARNGTADAISNETNGGTIDMPFQFRVIRRTIFVLNLILLVSNSFILVLNFSAEFSLYQKLGLALLALIGFVSSIIYTIFWRANLEPFLSLGPRPSFKQIDSNETFVLETWENCNGSSHSNSTLSSTFEKLRSFEICVTDIADELFVTFIVCSVLVFLYQLALLITSGKLLNYLKQQQATAHDEGRDIEEERADLELENQELEDQEQEDQEQDQEDKEPEDFEREDLDWRYCKIYQSKCYS